MFRLFKKNTAQKFGYKSDQQGIINRYIREKAGWDPHLANCKDFILNAVKQQKKGSIAILGSGWLLDVPLEELSNLCTKIFLVDIFHPTQVQHKASKFDNVELITYDITGGLIDEVDGMLKDIALKNYHEFPVNLLRSKPQNFGLPESEKADLVISLNLLNQLDILLCDHLKQKIKLDDKQLLPLRKYIQQSHLNALLESNFVLITDYQLNATDKRDNQSKEPLVFIDLPDSSISKEWIWEFDNSGHYLNRKRVFFNVKALFINE